MSIDKKLELINHELEAEIVEIQAAFELDALKFEKESIKPSKSGIKVNQVCLLWIP